MSYRATADGQTVTAETMRQLRVAIRLVMRPYTRRQAAARAECSYNTLCRILRGENVTIATAARIVALLGGQLEVRLAERKTQHVETQNPPFHPTVDRGAPR